jgi:hypothetical protein
MEAIVDAVERTMKERDDVKDVEDVKAAQIVAEARKIEHLRDMFACSAMNAMIIRGRSSYAGKPEEDIAALSYEMADAMIKAR